MSDDFLAADDQLKRRHLKGRIALGVLYVAAGISVLMLILLLLRLLSDGTGAFDAKFWLDRYNPLELRREDATGMRDSIITTFVVLLMTIVFALPIGVAAGVYLHEYAPKTRLTEWIRASVANLAGVPSVVYGLFGLAVFVRFLQIGANNMAAALTLSVLILPILIVATEEALKAVPRTVREASLALGATKWQTIKNHVLPYALPGILTGNILAMSRAAGETAPLLIIGLPLFAAKEAYGPLATGTPLQARAFSLSIDPQESALALAGSAILVLLIVTISLNLVAIILRQKLSNRIKW